MQQDLTVIAILKEPLAAVEGFVDWHRNEGASRFHLCFDDPDDPAADVMARVPDVVVDRATPAYWHGIGVDPAARFTLRQNCFLTHAYRQAPAGWCAVLDGDEFFHLEGRSLRDELEAQAPDCLSLTVRTAEHVQTPHDRTHYHFRLPQPRWLRKALYPNHAQLMRPRSGFVGHRHGKSCIRAGLGPDVWLRQHWAEIGKDRPRHERILGPGDGAHLLHFADRGYANWRAKLDWRLASLGFHQGMKTEVEAARAADDPEAALRKLHAELHVFGPEKLEMAAQAGRVVTVARDRFRFDPMAPPETEANEILGLRA